MEEIIYKEKDEEKFWRHWENYVSQNSTSPLYLKPCLEYFLLMSKKDDLLYKDKSFIYLVNNDVAGCVFLPLEKYDGKIFLTQSKTYINAPLIPNRGGKIEKRIFSLIDLVAKENNAVKIMFSTDPTEQTKPHYNYLQKYNYLDTSILTYVIDLNRSEDLLQACRKGHKHIIKKILKDKNFEIFYADEKNPSYDIHESYKDLHHKCAGRITRPRETFDKQFEHLKLGHAVLVGLKHKGGNIAFSYFTYNADKAIYFSGADDPAYDTLPLYHIMLWGGMQYLKKAGVRLISASQPSSPSAQLDYYPDEKELNIALFKRGFPGGFRQNFRGIKYFSKEEIEKDASKFIGHYAR